MSSETPPDAPHPQHSTDPAEKVVQAAEELVERAVSAAEHSLARRLGQRGLRAVLSGLRLVWMLTVLAYFAFGSTVLLTRYYLLPHIDDWRTNIESAASSALHSRVSVGRIEADWQGLRPRLLLSDVVLTDASGATVLTLPRVEVVVAWTSLLALQAHTHSLTVWAPQVEVRRLPDHRFTIAGILIDPQATQSDTAFIDWVLAQHDIRVRDARVHFVDELASADAMAAPSQAPTSATPSADGTQALTVAPAKDIQTEAAAIDFSDVNFLLRRGLTGHHFALQLRPPAQFSGLIDLRGEFAHPWSEPTARMSAWSGRLFVQFDYVDLARIDALTHLVPAPAHIQRAWGALRAWIDFSALQLTRLRADVALTDVAAQLRPDLQPLRLNKVQGRLTQTLYSDDSGQTQELALVGLQLDGPDQLHLPATDLLFRSTRLRNVSEAQVAERSRFEVNRIVLSDWSRLAVQLPLPKEWLATIERTAARGTLEDLRATWEGPATPPQTYSLRARFSQLGFSLNPQTLVADSEPSTAGTPSADAGNEAPAGRAYEFENLAGSVDLDQQTGSLRIDASKAHVRLPFLYDDTPIALDSLATRVHWSRVPASGLSIDVDSLAAANEDMDLSISGSYQAPGNGPARLDVSGRLNRAKVARASRYLPAVVAPPARSWLHGALIDGRVTQGAFYVHGDPKRFPFVDPKNGDFHAALHVLDGKMDVAPRPIEAGDTSSPATPQPAHPPSLWPLLSSIEADVVFDRNRLTVTARRANAYGYELANVTARVPQLDQPNQHLLIEGQGSGSLGELLHYIGESPVNAWTGGWLASAQGNGPTRLQMQLDIPLAKAVDTTVNGSLHFQGNSLTLRPEIAPFSAMTGELGFTQRGVKLSGITTGFLGGEVLLNGDTLADGTVSIRGNGNATPQGAKRQVTAVALRRFLDRTRGILQYGIKVTVHNGSYGLQFDSDLVGLAADLPEPFRKTAGEIRELHLESVPIAGSTPQRDTLRATLGATVSVELHRVADANNLMKIERGAIGIGAPANVPDAGLLLLIDQTYLDFDRWQQALGIGSAGAGTKESQDTLAAASPDQAALASAAGASGLEDIDLIAVHAGTLTLYNKSISNVSLSAKRDPDQSWDIDIDSDQAAGSLHWISARESASGRLTARLAKLAIPERDQKQVTELLNTPPTQFPALDIQADQFELGSSKFGQLEIQAQNSGAPGADTWFLQKLTISNPDGKLTGSGQWQRENASSVRKMSMRISLTYTNAGGMLSRFGLPGTIKNGSGKLEGDLSWRGSPFAIDYPSLAGNLHLTTEKGQFLKVDAGAGRLLGVLSLQSLPHRVTGDFRDVFSKGFAFDTLTASATIDNGTLTTDDFIMKGVNAVVRIKGSADLHAETQDLEVVVIPEINAGTASLAYALINPAIGLGTFVANFLLRKPLSAAFTNIYEVTGSWSDPKVERVKAESGATGTRPAG
ncbi:MAG TPA: YhdP family protein [Burkholderiaceae bacterium]|nr:YhdP family protein [Burkholderiaceae bacterium]